MTGSPYTLRSTRTAAAAAGTGGGWTCFDLVKVTRGTRASKVRTVAGRREGSRWGAGMTRSREVAPPHPSTLFGWCKPCASASGMFGLIGPEFDLAQGNDPVRQTRRMFSRCCPMNDRRAGGSSTRISQRRSPVARCYRPTACKPQRRSSRAEAGHRGCAGHQSELLQNNAVVVQGRAGVLLIDPGIQGSEMACLANDLRELGQPVVAGFSTHPDWDHVLWHAELGEAPRYGTARCAAHMRDLLSNADWKARVAEGLPPEIAEEIPLDLFGLITGLPAETAQVPWDGPEVRIIEHPAHAQGHAALLIEERGVLVAGDMLSDVLVPMLDFSAADPIEDYLAALRLLEGVAGDVDVLVPGHGSVGGADQVHARIERDRHRG